MKLFVCISLFGLGFMVVAMLCALFRDWSQDAEDREGLIAAIGVGFIVFGLTGFALASLAP